MKKLFQWALLFCMSTLSAQAQQVTLFETGDASGFPYRIPAITTAANGQIMALSDRRPCGNDIGYGRVDILGRISHDNGATWGEPFNILVGTGSGPETGYGDACIVADKRRNEILLVCVSGDVPYWSSKVEKSQRFVITHGHWNKKTKTWEWDAPTDQTTHIYKELLGGRINGLFMGSGRICQSKQVKVGKYYRLYGALCTHRGNFVIYSDNFGRSWKVLGSATESCAPKGDEPKCEELPDGSVLLSSRKHGGRYFNIYRYTNAKTGEGVWGHPVDSREAPGGISNEGTPCNGEIMMVDAINAQGKRTTLALQSIPAGPGRENVTIYWKELADRADYLTPLAFASNWQGSFQVSHTTSAYSTMTLQADGRIGFFWEENGHNNGYNMDYRALTIEQITDGKYKAPKK